MEWKCCLAGDDLTETNHSVKRDHRAEQTLHVSE